MQYIELKRQVKFYISSQSNLLTYSLNTKKEAAFLFFYTVYDLHPALIFLNSAVQIQWIGGKNCPHPKMKQ